MTSARSTERKSAVSTAELRPKCAKIAAPATKTNHNGPAGAVQNEPKKHPSDQRASALGDGWERAQVETVRWRLFQTAGKIVRHGR